MRNALLLIISVFIFSVGNGYSQTVSFSGKNIQLTKVFSAIKSQTGFVFFYDVAVLCEAKPVSINLTKVSIEEALKEILQRQSMEWLVESRTITVIRKPLPVAKLVSSNASQIIRIRAIVADKDHRAILGASIIEKGTERGTRTGANGAFSLAVQKGTVLIFSSAGYTEKQIRIEGNVSEIQLALDDKPTEHIIVAGNIMHNKRKAVVSNVRFS